MGDGETESVPGMRVHLVRMELTKFRGRRVIAVSLVSIVVMSGSALAEQQPPFVGVEWLTPSIIDVSDPSWLRSVTYAGRGERHLWDHVKQDWIMRNAFLFNVKYEGRQGLTEFQVHPEYGGEASAREQVDLYAPVIGRLPRVLLSNAKEVEIQSEPTNPYSATANVTGIFHINPYLAEHRLSRGLLEETLIHEGGHVSLDLDHARSPGWQAAQRADGVFINNYARDFPEREDVAESILAYFVTHYRPGRIAARDVDTILAAIPNRLAYFDAQRFDMSPYVRVATVPQPPEPVPALSLLGQLLLALGLGGAGAMRLARATRRW